MSPTAAPDERAGLERQVLLACRLLWRTGLVSASDGNVSVRWGSERLITTPSGGIKGLLRRDGLVVTDLEGRVLEGDGRPSAELRLHLEVYRQRRDVSAVVHAHPPITTALTVAGVSLAPCVLPETLVTLGTLLTTAYATPTSAQGPEVIAPYIAEHDALVLDRHGAVTVGRSVLEAYGRMEKVENTAQVLAQAYALGQVSTLPLDEVRRLVEMRRAYLGPGRRAEPDCDLCGACPGLEGATTAEAG